jgi:hypothetical protein
MMQLTHCCGAQRWTADPQRAEACISKQQRLQEKAGLYREAANVIEHLAVDMLA